ncbi:NosD domain-containing protein [Methanococcoides orientis]|uniref:NosD domain-containing protein n=1 Tax=Methanococcoides orientis TaxID=2822137 RepID=UPI0021753A0F
MQDIDSTNLVDGKPVYYWVNRSDDEIHPDAGSVYVINSRNITVKDIELSNEFGGVMFAYTDNSTIENVTALGNFVGVALYSSNYNTLNNINNSNNEAGIYLYNSSNNNLNSNTVNSNDYYGIYLYDSNNNTLTNSNASFNDFGIVVASTTNNTLINSNASSNYFGIILESTTNNTLINSNASSNDYYGIALDSTTDTTLNNNTANSNDFGIYIYDSSNNTLTNNAMSSNNHNFGIDGENLEDLINDIDSSNQVDNKPIYYWTSRSDKKVSSDAGAVYVINSTNITVKDIELANGYNNVLLAYTNNSTIQNVTTSEGNNGVKLIFSNFNTLDDITATSNDYYGIYLYDSSNNILTNNTASSNDRGIYLRDSNNNTLNNNDASSNDYYGIYIYNSNNHILNNNTANNNSNTNDYELSSMSLDSVITPNRPSSSLYEDHIRDYRDNTVSFNELDSISLNSVFSTTSKSSSTSYGIRVVSANNITFTENNAIGNGDYEFYASSSENVTVDGLVLTNNSAQVSFTSDLYYIGISGDDENSIALSGKTNVNGYVTITRSDDLNVTFLYDDSEMSSAGEASLTLYSLVSSEWIAVPNSSLNKTDNYVSANLTESGTFGLFKIAESSSSSPSSPGSNDGSVAARVRAQGTVTDLPVNGDGEVTDESIVKSSDTKTTLTLSKGTITTDPSGNPVNKIIVTVPASLPADTPADVINSGLYYDFGPSGTTFSKDVMITIEFDPEDFGGRAPTIYTYTSEDGWISLETTVDWENGIATAMTRHFSFYALFGNDAEEVEDQTVETPEVNTGSTVIVGEETPIQNSNSSPLYWIIGIGIILMLGIVVVKKQKDGGGR